MKLSAEIITTISSERHANLQGREEEVNVLRATRLEDTVEGAALVGCGLPLLQWFASMLLLKQGIKAPWPTLRPKRGPRT